MQIALAPMEGLVDHILRGLLTEQGGIDWCVTEFIRVTDQLLPSRSFYRLAPELEQGAQTCVGTPVRVQLLGSDPVALAENAAKACELGAPVIDLNFGCPAKTVNNSNGGAILLREPERLFKIVETVRAGMPKDIALTTKMRLGYDSPEGAMDSARALAAGGSAQIVVHARTKVDGYKPPAHWEWVAKVQDVVDVPVFANGDIWTLEDWYRCREISGVDHVMLGRGLVSCPDLAKQIAAARDGIEYQLKTWQELQPLLREFWRQARLYIPARFAPGRLKQWLALLTRNYPEAQQLFLKVRKMTDCSVIDQLFGFSSEHLETVNC
ncbi:tRNA-dihydrouridine synthase [Denitrificimonas sp. JX-1]|uniref:tRNA-dihydrouridine(16) synthase n=1 Tax=Denitrificimonas halotolerans TaxID=3098930 RepID=A0ABU5GRK4_9GAMM|nr:tRNA-dihydrouridine synthase [Denitrificimonas sp. JX-1]MDY7218836.1 tRNA-dihydrouridine synthase [Denitrificimonas sp. JX-1]